MNEADIGVDVGVRIGAAVPIHLNEFGPGIYKMDERGIFFSYFNIVIAFD